MENPKSRIDSELTIVRLSYLLQEGFTKQELSDLTGVNFNTLKKILSAYPKKVTIATHEKVKAFHSNYITAKSDYDNQVPYFDDEPVIDSEDELKAVKEITAWVYTVIITAILVVIGLFFAIKYTIGLM